jgi:phosphoserine phosphatase RsbU/P
VAPHRDNLAAVRSALPSTAGQPVTFLLVDDLEENLLALEALLRREGVRLLKARSGREALEALLVHEVALALIDVQMPEMDGFELAELIRGSERTCQVPIIFVTAAGGEPQRRFRGYEAGAVDFLYKPIEPHVLQSKANVFFELSAQRQQLAAQVKQLRTEAEFRRRMLESSGDCIKVLDLDGRLLFVNGYGAAQLHGIAEKDGLWCEVWEGEHRAAAERALAVARQGQASRFVGECAQGSGASRWWEVAVSPILDAEGAVERLLCISRDVTERRRAEQERELFMAVLGHDLRNPLASLMAGTEAVLRRNDDPRLQATARRMLQTQERMTQLVNDLLDVTRARAGGGIPVSPEAMDLGELVLRAVAELHATHPDARVELEVEGATGGRWDQARLHQVLTNLLANALQHGTPGAPVRLRVNGGAAAVVQLTVTNAGEFPAGLRAHLFDPFRTAGAPEGKRERLGLGLYIVRQIVCAHRGEVEVDLGTPGEITFVVRLPR